MQREKENEQTKKVECIAFYKPKISQEGSLSVWIEVTPSSSGRHAFM